MKKTFLTFILSLLLAIVSLLGQWTIGYNTVHDVHAQLEDDHPLFIFNSSVFPSTYADILFTNDFNSTIGRIRNDYEAEQISFGFQNQDASFRFNLSTSDLLSDDPADQGIFVIGQAGYANSNYLSFDNNEIQSRRGDIGANLYLNYRGGDVSIGQEDIYYDALNEQLGIGTKDNGQYKVAIGGSDFALKLDAPHPRIQFNDGVEEKAYIRNFASDMYYINQSQGYSYFGNGGLTMLSLDAQGYLGIGENEPAVPLHIKHDAEEMLRLESTGEDYTYMSFYNAGQRKAYIVNTASNMFYMNEEDGDSFIGNGGIPQMVIRGDGNVGIGSFEPEYKLEVAGSGNFTGELTAASDRKLKKSIKPIEDANEIIKKLNPVEYYYRSEEYSDLNLSKTKRWGLIAQEVEEILPELVSTKQRGICTNGEWEDYKAINYIDLIPILIEAFQKNQEEITSLKEQLEIQNQ